MNDRGNILAALAQMLAGGAPVSYGIGGGIQRPPGFENMTE